MISDPLPAAAAVSPQEYRSAFMEDARYLNFASLGPASRRVVDTGARLLQATATAKPEDAALVAAQMPAALALLSRLTGFAQQNITLVPSTSSALVHVALGLPAGSGVVTGRYQFPANVWPWRNAADAGRIGLKLVGAPEEPVTPELLRASLDPQCDAVAISLVDFRTGYRADLARIREAVGERLLIVDAIQAFGAVDADWALADVVIAGAQKWIRAAQGVGFMALSDRALERIAPVAANWAGMEDCLDIHRNDYRPLASAARFDATRFSPVLAGCLGEALALMEGVGTGWIEQQIAERYEVLAESVARHGLRLLSDWPAAHRGGIAVVEAPDDAALARLAAAQFAVTVHETRRVRISLHATTQAAAIEDAIATLAGA